jgi:predicted TIM-barrel fold metal-dependent hydrolase
MHVHLAGVGTGGSGCWISPAFRRRPIFLGLRMLHGIGPRQMATIDEDWAAQISRHVEASELDAAVVLGFDGVYDAAGRLDRTRTQMLIPQEWVFEVCRRHGNLLPGVSINPWRADALDRLEMAIEGGAVLIKWLPIVQGFDPASPRTAPFLRKLAAAGIPLLVHAGSGEMTFRTVDGSVGDIIGLLPALEEGVTVICAHAGAPAHYQISADQTPVLMALLERFPNLWVDNSGMMNIGRFRHIPRIANDPVIRERVMHGSDFPVPPSAMLYANRIGIRRARELTREPNPMQREIAIKRALGMPAEALTRAGRILANLDRWLPTRPADTSDPHSVG